MCVCVCLLACLFTLIDRLHIFGQSIVFPHSGQQNTNLNINIFHPLENMFLLIRPLSVFEGDEWQLLG